MSADATDGDPAGDVMREGSYVLLYGTSESITGVRLARGAVVQNKYGRFRHDDIIGRPYGTKIYSEGSVLPRPAKARRLERSDGPQTGEAESGGNVEGGDEAGPSEREAAVGRSGRAGWVAALAPSPELITLSVQLRTQIVRHADISLILMLLDARPGRTIIEAGTGSGSLSSSLGRAVSPGGRLFTFEFNQQRFTQNQENFRLWFGRDTPQPPPVADGELAAAASSSGGADGGADESLSVPIVAGHRDVCADGFPDSLTGAADGVFLDMPAPWLALPHADKTLKVNGRVCVFAPCIEQVQRVTDLLTNTNYTGVRTFECVNHQWGIHHTGHQQTHRSLTPSASPSTPAAPSGALSFPMPTRGHTGYVTIATKEPPQAEQEHQRQQQQGEGAGQQQGEERKEKKS